MSRKGIIEMTTKTKNRNQYHAAVNINLCSQPYFLILERI